MTNITSDDNRNMTHDCKVELIGLFSVFLDNDIKY